MIVVQVADPTLRRAAIRATRPEEDAITGSLAYEAIEFGFPRLVVRGPGGRSRAWHAEIPVLEIEARTVRAWDAARRGLELPRTRLEFLSERIGGLIEERAERRTPADRVISDLSRAAGARLPLPFVGFARRVMEFPWHYRSLYPIAHVCGMTRGALKARFRRRGLSTPTTYLRWLRVLAVSNLLSDRSVTVAAAARRLGFTSDGNLCRMVWSVSGRTPTELRAPEGWRRLLLTFAWEHLSEEDLEAWASLDDLFHKHAA